MEHVLTNQEREAMRKLSNVVFDQLNNDLELNEERTDLLTQVIVAAAERWLEEGN